MAKIENKFRSLTILPKDTFFVYEEDKKDLGILISNVSRALTNVMTAIAARQYKSKKDYERYLLETNPLNYGLVAVFGTRRVTILYKGNANKPDIEKLEQARCDLQYFHGELVRVEKSL